MKKRIFLTGATGIFGSATLSRLVEKPELFDVTVLVRDSARNRKKLSTYPAGSFNVIWGDLLDYDYVKLGVENADIVLHVGGLVSPKADRFPEQTLKTNVGAMRNIIRAVKEMNGVNEPAVVYIGSVSQYGTRQSPLHWCRCGDPMIAAEGDCYAVSKIISERELAESGIKKWVSLRQTGILYPELVMKGTDPISFHVPLNGVLEWATKEQSGRLLANLCETELPDSFWRKFYNIGGGEKFRLSNYEFEKKLMESLHCPPPEKVFEPNWFATRNFHGVWYTDSDALEKLIPFRGETSADSYFNYIGNTVPGFFKLAGVVPPVLIKNGMKLIAKKKGLGTLNWIKEQNDSKIASFFKSIDDWKKIPSWKDYKIEKHSDEVVLLDHGYDETKPISELGIEDMRQVASFRGGRCLSENMEVGEMWQPLEWECAEGHRFKACPGTVLLGGHWCEECLPPKWRYNAEAKINPFLAQAWYNTHDVDEKDID